MIVWSTCVTALHPVAQSFLMNDKKFYPNQKIDASIVDDWEKKNAQIVQRYVHEKPFFITRLHSKPTKLVQCLVDRNEHVLVAHSDQVDMWTVRRFPTHAQACASVEKY